MKKEPTPSLTLSGRLSFRHLLGLSGPDTCFGIGHCPVLFALMGVAIVYYAHPGTHRRVFRACVASLSSGQLICD